MNATAFAICMLIAAGLVYLLLLYVEANAYWRGIADGYDEGYTQHALDARENVDA